MHRNRQGPLILKQKKVLSRLALAAGLAFSTSGSIEPPPHDPNPTVSPVTPRERMIDEIYQNHRVKMFNPDRPLSTEGIASEFFEQLETDRSITTVEGVRPRVMWRLHSLVMASLPEDEFLATTTNAEIQELAERYDIQIQPWDSTRIDMIRRALGFIPESVYADAPHEVELYLIDRKAEPKRDRLIQAEGRTIRVGELENIGTIPGPPATCECSRTDGLRPFQDDLGLEPSIIFDRSYFSPQTPEERLEALQMVVHEVVHIKTSHADRKDEQGATENHIIDGGLASLGGLTVDGYMKKLQESGDLHISLDDESFINEIRYSSAIGYSGVVQWGSLSEFIPRAADMYLLGKKYFVGEFGRVFVEENAINFYKYIQGTIFDGREFTEHELQLAANSPKN